MSGKLIKRITLLAVIFFLPFSLFYFFSLGSHQFGRLPFYGPDNSDGSPFVYEDFSFKTANGILSKKNLEGKITIATVVTSSCPDECDLAAREFRFMAYNDLIRQKKFSDVLIISELIDTNHAKLKDMNERFEVDTNRWIFYQTPQNPIFEVALNDHRLNEKTDEKRGKPYYYRFALLIDKELHIRGWYDCSQTIEIKRLMDELRLLKKEYDRQNQTN